MHCLWMFAFIRISFIIALVKWVPSKNSTDHMLSILCQERVRFKFRSIYVIFEFKILCNLYVLNMLY